MAAKRDYYMILGVPPISQPEDIRKAYRALSKKYHPDLNPDMKHVSDEKMKELVEAYNTLNDKDKRKGYDAQPQFQLRRHAKGRRPSKSDFTKKAKPKKESFLQKFFAGFFKKDKKGDGAPDPKQADVHFTLGLSMSENESFLDQAKGEFKLAVKFDASHREAVYNLALTAWRLGEFDEARMGFQDVLKLSGDDPHAKKMLSLLHDPDM